MKILNAIIRVGFVTITTTSRTCATAIGHVINNRINININANRFTTIYHINKLYATTTTTF
ncbi:hypothetical protein D3C81_2047230 [compost metagenome]